MTPDQLRTFRKSLGLSQAEFARAVGVSSDRTVRKWEDGERDIPGPVEALSDLAATIPAVGRELRRRAAT